MNRNSVCIIYFLLYITVACSKFKDSAPFYRYQIPTAQHELETSSLEREGINGETITQMTNLILQEKYKRINAVLILKNNRLPVDVYFASGNGEQEIFIVPGKDLAVVFTTGNVNTSLDLQNIYMIRITFYAL